jgi:hypothetical protein
MGHRYPVGTGRAGSHMVRCSFIRYNNMAVDWQKALRIALVTGILGIIIYFLWDYLLHV